MFPVEITNQVQLPTETTATTEAQSNWSASETVENRCFRLPIELAYERAEPSVVTGTS